MMRHHALGFSYQAVTGQKCNLSDVTCQVLNLDYLEDNNLCYSTNVAEVVDTSFVQRGIADYAHSTGWNTYIGTDLVLYQGEKWKHSYLHENISDTTLTMHHTLGLQTGRKEIRLSRLFDSDNENLDEEDREGELRRNPEGVLSENFRFALRKLEAGRNNEAVIDSFVNIFGTHVVTGVSMGGTCYLKVKTSKRFVATYLEEQEYTRNAIDLTFKKKETIETLSNPQSYRNLFRTAEMELKVRGGDITVFDKLVSNPSFDNVQASYSNYEAWLRSVAEHADSPWNEGSELIDMTVTPIWNFIPDKDLSERVKTRIIATASAMRDLYGERNFTSAIITVSSRFCPMSSWGDSFKQQFFVPTPLQKYYNSCDPGVDPYTDMGNSYLHAVCSDGKPSRIVAVTYWEYIPEIDRHKFVPVTYPVYENRIQLTEGIAIYYDNFRYSHYMYSVKWLYDRFVVDKINGVFRRDAPNVFRLYLYKGRFFLNLNPGPDALWTSKLLDYEWPGSIDINGNVASGGEVYQVLKFFDKFYLQSKQNTAKRIDNLPGWYYKPDRSKVVPDYYKNSAFWLVNSRNHIYINYMVRDDDYRYKIIPQEIEPYERKK